MLKISIRKMSQTITKSDDSKHVVFGQKSIGSVPNRTRSSRGTVSGGGLKVSGGSRTRFTGLKDGFKRKARLPKNLKPRDTFLNKSFFPGFRGPSGDVRGVSGMGFGRVSGQGGRKNLKMFAYFRLDPWELGSAGRIKKKTVAYLK